MRNGWPRASDRLPAIVLGAVLATGMALASAGFAGRWIIVESLASATLEACDLVEQHYYRAEEAETLTWVDGCRALAAKPVYSKANAVARLNELLARFETSHFSVYDPQENRRVWEHESRDNGLRVRMIEAAWVVHAIVDTSPGHLSGVREGDEIVSVNGLPPNSAEELRGSSGAFLIRRRALNGGLEEREFDIESVDSVEDQSPSLNALSNETVHVKISSFLPQYFERDQWIKFARALQPFRSVVLDLRGNPGGSFPAMLRVASIFFCARERLGNLIQASSGTGSGELDLPDDLNPESQLAVLARSNVTAVRAYQGYPCFNGPITALVDGGTSSTAEVLAEAFGKRPGSRVWGQPTSGQAVLARWYPLAKLGGDYSLSIPIAGYVGSSGRKIEGEGLSPERSLFYRLEEARRGLDSWLVEASRTH